MQVTGLRGIFLKVFRKVFRITLGDQCESVFLSIGLSVYRFIGLSVYRFIALSQGLRGVLGLRSQSTLLATPLVLCSSVALYKINEFLTSVTFNRPK